MRQLLNSVLFLFIFSSIFAQTNNDDKKPVLKLDVNIDGKQFSINDGDTLHLDDKSIIIKTSNYMTFDFGSLKFDYPKYFGFQFEQDVAYKNWTLDGNDFVIMYFELGVQVELDVYINAMVKKFGKKNCTITDKQIRLGEIELIGKRINIDLIGEKLTYDMYKITTNDFNSHFIAFQDSKNENGYDSFEGLETMEIINRTIKLK